jgi:predicted nuclease of predicted toxin-antitoxin system
MKLLLDEMYTGLKDHLEVLGWEVETVKDAGITGKQDREIAEHAKKNSLLLITQDQKPAELTDLLGAKNVLITTASIAAMVDREIREKYPETR